MINRKLSAILSADVKGYSILMADDEIHTIETLKSYRQIISDLISKHSGRVVDSPGDNILAEFRSIVDAVNCAVKIQRKLDQENSKFVDDKKVQFRIGVNIGDVVQDEDRIYGNGVNVAARIEGLAESGGICISRNAYDHIKNKVKLGYEYLGEQEVKNIKDPIRVYKVLMAPEDAGKLIGEETKRAKKKWLLPVAVVAAIIVTSIVWYFTQRVLKPEFEPASVENMAYPLPEKPSIAVLPFDNMSGDPEQDFFADGITEQIITGLSNVPKLFVMSRNATFTYKGKPVKPKQVAEELGVKYVLEGSVQKFDERIRVNAQLIDALAGHHLWAEQYDRDLKDIFALQDEITKKIITAMRVKLTAGEQARIYEKATNNLSAFFKYLNAREHIDRNNKEDNVIAKKLLEETIALDPKFALAHSLLGAAHLNDIGFGLSKNPKASITQAIKLTKKAIALDESLARPHALMALIYTLTKQYQEAASKCEQALELDPNDERAHFLVGTALRFAGRWKEAILVYEKAIRLNPYPQSNTYYGLGLAYCFTGQFEKAIEACQRATQSNPNDLFAHVTLTAVYGMAGRNEEARDSAKKALKIDPKFTIKSWKNILRLKNQSELKRYVEALRNAGLPDEPPLPLPDKPSIAVLPFVNMSNDPEQDFFADGMTDELLTNLSKISGLLVISRNSSFVYKGKTVTIQQVADELKVKYVLEGSIQRAGDRVRIRAQLIDGATDHHLWAETYDAIMENIFDLQDKITKKIAAVLAVKLTTKEQNRLANKETTNIQAYDTFVKGWELLHRETPDDLALAISLFKEAIELDNMYSRAHAALAWAYLSSSLRFKWQEVLHRHNQVRLMARKHLELAMRNPNSTAHLVASKMAMFRRQYEDSLTHAQLAIAYDANDPDANLNMAQVLIATGNPEEGLDFANKVLQLDPRNIAAPLSAAGMAYFIMGDLQKAATMTERAVAHNPTIVGYYERLSAIYALLDQNQDAQAAYNNCLKTWEIGRFPANLVTIMSSFLIKDRQIADRYADGLVKAGWPGKPSEYYKIYDQNILTGEEIGRLVFGQEITIEEFGKKYWFVHSEKGRLKDISRVREGKWWIEGDMLCHQLESGITKGLNDCGEIFLSAVHTI